MNKLSKLSLAAFALAMVFGLVLTAFPTFASSGNFDLTVKHNINGRSLGLDKDLAVDIWANGAPFETNVTFGDKLEANLPAGEYTIEVKLSPSIATDPNVMTLGPVDIPADVSVVIRAQLGSDGAPQLKARIK